MSAYTKRLKQILKAVKEINTDMLDRTPDIPTKVYHGLL
jgi:hypothetical protein